MLLFKTRIFLALDIFVWFLRILQVTSNFSSLGPKIIMIQKMARDLSFFLVIILIFMLSFGVITQVNQKILLLDR